jgi:hypothetical protein
MKRSPLSLTVITTTLLYLLTALHHAYGAWLYDTPWRMHIVPQGLTFLAICFAFLGIYLWKKWKIFLVLYLAAALLLFGCGIGLYEGLYNHVLKNILFFAGVESATLLKMFPPPLYEMPDDFLFEFSGILQFAAAVFQIKYIVSCFREKILKN